MSDRLLRTFISIPIPNEVRTKKNMLYSTLENSPSKINWVKNEQLHLTIKFLGLTPESLFNEIKDGLCNIVSSITPFDLIIDKTGCFPVPERPRVLWLGIDGNIKTLTNLFVKIENKMDQLGFSREEQDYFPHITLARVKYPQKYTPNTSKILQKKPWKKKYKPKRKIIRFSFF